MVGPAPAEFDTGRLGAMSSSGGGMHTFFSTCIDQRTDRALTAAGSAVKPAV